MLQTVYLSPDFDANSERIVLLKFTDLFNEDIILAKGEESVNAELLNHACNRLVRQGEFVYNLDCEKPELMIANAVFNGKHVTLREQPLLTRRTPRGVEIYARISRAIEFSEQPDYVC